MSAQLALMKLGRKTRTCIVVLVTAVITILLAVFILNLRTGGKHLRYEVPHLFAVADPEFQRSMGQLLGPGILAGNRVDALQNGDEIFPAMLEAIRGAQETINLETYIFWSGEIGRDFTDALSERAKAGVKVHVIFDWVGSGKLTPEYIEDMKAAGVKVQLYRPLSWYHLTRMNHRSHRKLLIVDGKIGFTGGVGIADAWLGDAETKAHWRDSHYRVEGPVVAQLQATFIDNWLKTDAQILFGSDYFPELESAGEMSAQAFKSSYGEGSESVRLMYMLSMASAANSIRLQAAYFVPDDLAIETMISARERGVKIEIIVPGPHTDADYVKSAGRSRWGDLLDAGVEIYEYQPAMYHCKVMIVDDLWVSVGSTNFDDRSFRLNDEANLNIYDADFAAQQVAVFDEDKSHSRRMTRAEFKNRSSFQKLWDHVAGAFRRQL